MEIHNEDAVTALVGGANRLHVTLEGVAHYIYSSDALTPAMMDHHGVGFNARIPGSVLRSERDVERFRHWCESVAKQGEWVRDPVPRQLPSFKLDGYSGCDKRHVQAGGVAWGEAEAVAEKWEGYAAQHAGEEGTAEYQRVKEEQEKAWRVREAIKYAWRLKDGSVPFERTYGEDLCAFATEKWNGQRSLNLLVIGDSLNEQLSVALVNALMLNGEEDASHHVLNISFVSE